MGRDQMLKDIIEHFGTKGMKWGVRKKPGSGKSKTSAQIAKTLTNKELTKRVNRLNMEKRYSDLSKESARTSMSVGKKAVNDFVENFGKEYPKAFGKKAAKRGAAVSVNVLADAIEKKVRG